MAATAAQTEKPKNLIKRLERWDISTEMLLLIPTLMVGITIGASLMFWALSAEASVTWTDWFGWADGNFIAPTFHTVFEGDRVDRLDRFTKTPLSSYHSHVLGHIEQLITKFGMGNADHGNDSFLQTLAKKIGHSIFRGNPVDITPGDNDGNLRRHWNNGAFLTIRSG